ncbi:MAG: prohibitin family protein [Anaerolineae bacterium]|nr:prohibitin family protein [Thermoflexales bacterium]MDW8407009.1 prohibitin family protein [Anaerolineae bacterium]
MRQDFGGFGGSGQPTSGRGVTLLVTAGVLLLVIAVVLLNSYTVIEAGTRGVLKNFGQIVGVLGEGLHFRAPFISTVTIVDVKTQRYESNASAASRDLQIVSTQVVLNYRPDPNTVDTLVREIGPEYERRVVDPAVQEALKAATAQFTAEELITKRPQVSAAIQDVLEARLSVRGIIVESVAITDFNFSEEFTRAIEAKQVAEQDALRAQNELRRAQIEAQQQVARAEAEAKARLEVARAEAEALRLQREVISPALLQLRFIERWDGVLPRVMGGGESGGVFPFLMIPAEELTTPATPARPAPTPTPAPTPAP